MLTRTSNSFVILVSLFPSCSSTTFHVIEKAQDVLLRPATYELGLTASNVTLDLSFLANNMTDELQDLVLNGNELSVTKSNGTVDLSHLGSPTQDLTFNRSSLLLGLSESRKDVNLAPLLQELSFDGNDLEIGLGSKVKLSPLRVTTLQASIDKINGADSDMDDLSGSRKLRKDSSSRRKLPGKKALVVEYGGKPTSGWTMMRNSRLLGISIAVDKEFSPKSGILEIVATKCTDMDAIEILGSASDVLTLGPGDGRSKVLEFEKAIDVEAGCVICFQATRDGKVKSIDKYNAASLVMMVDMS